MVYMMIKTYLPVRDVKLPEGAPDIWKNDHQHDSKMPIAIPLAPLGRAVRAGGWHVDPRPITDSQIPHGALKLSAGGLGQAVEPPSYP